MGPSPALSPRRRLHRFRRAVLARRRLLAAVTAALTVAVGFQAAAPPLPDTRVVLAAARDLPAGTVVSSDDLVPAEMPPAAVPAGVLTGVADVVGRTTTGPVRAGEVLTDVRLVRGSLLDGYPGRVAMPVRVADPDAVALLRIGDRIDVLSADPQGREPATVVAESAVVLALPRAGDAALASGGLVVLAVTEETARSLAAHAVGRYLSVVLRR